MIDLDELDRLHAAATPGRWCRDADIESAVDCLDSDEATEWFEARRRRGFSVIESEFEENRASAIALHNAYPALAAEIRALRAAIAAMTVMCAGQPCYRTESGTPMDMPVHERARVRKALRGDA